jgi:phosphopantothenoylcysteine decarboxylase/phosphopantothenate--cysteine ligase
MGHALAWDAFARGAEVTLIHGPTDLLDPVGIKSIGINTAQEMFEKVKHYFTKTDLYISAAAIADYKPVKEQRHKIKKTEETFSLKLDRNPDILKFVGNRKNSDQLLVESRHTQIRWKQEKQ